MDYQRLFKELTYAGVKVFVYCMTHREGRDHIGFGSWLGMEYSNAVKTWKRGMQELETIGYMQDNKWTKKAKDVIIG